MTDTFKQARSHKVKTRTLSKDPAMALQEVMETISTLRDIYAEENNALTAADTKGFLALQDRKLEVAQVYQDRISELLARKHELSQVSPDLKNKLAAMQREFAELAGQNRNALERMQRCMNHLGNRLREAAQDAMRKQRAVSYGRTGRMQDDPRKTVSAGIITTA